MAHEENEYVFVLTQKLAPPSPVGLKTSGESVADDESLVAITPQSSLSSLSSSLPRGDEEDGDAGKDADRSDSDDSAEVEVDSLPMAMPFLPALDASTEITLHEGYEEAVEGAQRHLDSRLLAYSQYQQMVRLLFCRPCVSRVLLSDVCVLPEMLRAGSPGSGAADPAPRQDGQVCAD
jgi:hypothetical protein